MLRPADQPNPGAYVQIKERLKDGIVVEGCKVHISEASVADEVLVVPTRALRPEDKDYAVAFAVPGDWDGLKQVVTIHNLRPREHYKRGFVPGATDSYMIFDNCFVPWERVFLAGEYQHGGACALLFALFHRHSYSGCKPAIGDVILGTAALAAEVNNIHKESHVREKLAEIIMTIELGYAAGYTASDLGKPEVYIPGIGFVPYGPGSYIPNSIYCNVGRCLSGEAVWREAEILCDIAGGVVATFPHEKDFLNPETGDLLLKYTKRNPEHVGGGSGPVLALPGRRALLGHGRHQQHRQLPRRRLADHGADRHHDPVRHRVPEEAGEVHRRHERRRPRSLQLLSKERADGAGRNESPASIGDAASHTVGIGLHRDPGSRRRRIEPCLIYPNFH